MVLADGFYFATVCSVSGRSHLCVSFSPWLQTIRAPVFFSLSLCCKAGDTLRSGRARLGGQCVCVLCEHSGQDAPALIATSSVFVWPAEEMQALSWRSRCPGLWCRPPGPRQPGTGQALAISGHMICHFLNFL